MKLRNRSFFKNFFDIEEDEYSLGITSKDILWALEGSLYCPFFGAVLGAVGGALLVALFGGEFQHILAGIFVGAIIGAFCLCFAAICISLLFIVLDLFVLVFGLFFIALKQKPVFKLFASEHCTAEKVMRVFLSSEIADDAINHFNERAETQRESRGLFLFRLWYWWQAACLLPPLLDMLTDKVTRWVMGFGENRFGR